MMVNFGSCVPTVYPFNFCEGNSPTCEITLHDKKGRHEKKMDVCLWECVNIDDIGFKAEPIKTDWDSCMGSDYGTTFLMFYKGEDCRGDGVLIAENKRHSIKKIDQVKSVMVVN